MFRHKKAQSVFSLGLKFSDSSTPFPFATPRLLAFSFLSNLHSG